MIRRVLGRPACRLARARFCYEEELACTEVRGPSAYSLSHLERGVQDAENSAIQNGI
jgi:hypothetical protein